MTTTEKGIRWMPMERDSGKGAHLTDTFTKDGFRYELMYLTLCPGHLQVVREGLESIPGLEGFRVDETHPMGTDLRETDLCFIRRINLTTEEYEHSPMANRYRGEIAFYRVRNGV